ncbi:unnamed protein product [Albugo candida]|uniref:Uncharacterized protein n=1 Tax=Albugo candida TaxID=65357 RepID=A0A024FY83_9STRA|nr:unnamed protein product [Albugo candida]|eukprot:CCI11624.1 unnamed protein product [Albugo candida]
MACIASNAAQLVWKDRNRCSLGQRSATAAIPALSIIDTTQIRAMIIPSIFQNPKINGAGTQLGSRSASATTILVCKTR